MCDEKPEQNLQYSYILLSILDYHCSTISVERDEGGEEDKEERRRNRRPPLAPGPLETGPQEHSWYVRYLKDGRVKSGKGKDQSSSLKAYPTCSGMMHSSRPARADRHLGWQFQR